MRLLGLVLLFEKLRDRVTRRGLFLRRGATLFGVCSLSQSGDPCVADVLSKGPDSYNARAGEIWIVVEWSE